MIFLSTLIVLLLLRWGVGSALQRDGWFTRWVDFLHSRSFVRTLPLPKLVLGIGVPVVAVVLLSVLVTYFLSSNWLLLLYVPVLIYSLGRGNLTAEVDTYMEISQRGDTVAASRWVDNLRGHAEADIYNAEVDDWQKLHTQTLAVLSYRSLERLFAVLFWFFILGAAGALLYRLTVLYGDRTASLPEGRLARRGLWLLEWPVVRAVSLSWALVGNFDSCFNVLRRDVVDFSLSSMTALSRSLRGALGMTPAVAIATLPAVEQPEDGQELSAPVISGINTEPNSLGLVKASLPIFSRTLLLWVCVVAVITIII